MDTRITYRIPSIILEVAEYHPLEQIDLESLNFCFADAELSIPAFASHRTQELQIKGKLIEEIGLDTSSGEIESDDARDTGAASNIFDIFNPDSKVTGDNGLNIENANSCDGNEIDVVGDIDMDDLPEDDSERKAGRLFEDYINVEGSMFIMVSLSGCLSS